MTETPAGPAVVNRARARVLRSDAPQRRLQRATVVAERAARFSVESAYAHAERRIAFTSAGLVPRRGYRQHELFLRLHAHMVHEYRPSGTFDGPVLVVRSDAPIDVDERPRHDLGWSKLVAGPLTAVEVPSDHLDLLRRPAVEKVGGANVTRAPRTGGAMRRGRTLAVIVGLVVFAVGAPAAHAGRTGSNEPEANDYAQTALNVMPAGQYGSVPPRPKPPRRPTSTTTSPLSRGTSRTPTSPSSSSRNASARRVRAPCAPKNPRRPA